MTDVDAYLTLLIDIKYNNETKIYYTINNTNNYSKLL